MLWCTGPLLEKYREQLKPEAIGEIEAGLALTSGDVARAMMQHGQLLAVYGGFKTLTSSSCAR